MKRIERVLVTGGAGFIGSHTADLLLEKGYQVTVLDNFEPQVHRGSRELHRKHPSLRLIAGDVRDRKLLGSLILEHDAVMHLAAAVGVGQSMYQIENYVDVNTRGTATLLDVLANEAHGVRKLVVASSMSIYGEGRYFCEKCNLARNPGLRGEGQLRSKVWEQLCNECGTKLVPIPTDEEKPLVPTSIYSQSKRHQEEMCLLIGKTYGIPTVALRYFNVYGARQSLSNPYTGVCAIFLSRVLNNAPPFIFEDGLQVRDFIDVKDVAKANLLALERSGGDYQAINVGAGRPASILQIAQTIIKLCDAPVRPILSGKYRKGDIRHCYASTKKAEELLGFKASVPMDEGLKELASWAMKNKETAQDLFEMSLEELEKKGLGVS